MDERDKERLTMVSSNSKKSSIKKATSTVLLNTTKDSLRECLRDSIKEINNDRADSDSELNRANTPEKDV